MFRQFCFEWYSTVAEVFHNKESILIGVTQKSYNRASDVFRRLEYFIFSDLNTSRDILHNNIIFLFVNIHSYRKSFISRSIIAYNYSSNVFKYTRLFVLVLKEGSNNYSHSVRSEIQNIVYILCLFCFIPAKFSCLFEMRLQTFQSLKVHGTELLHITSLFLSFAQRKSVVIILKLIV